MTVENYKSVFGDKTAEDIKTICTGMARVSFTSRGILALLGIAAIIGCCVFFFSRNDWKDYKNCFLFTLIFYVCYQLGTLGMYLFSMPGGEATSLASSDRYLKTIIIAIFMLYIAFALKSFSSSSISENIKTLTAGKPYFFIAEGEEIRGNKTGAELTEAGDGVNGFYGYISSTDASMELTTWHADYTPGADNTFVIYNNSVFRINQGGTMLKSERCYININSTEPSRTAVPKNNARRRVVMGVQGTQVATGLENGGLMNDEMVKKVLIDGTMYIIRGEKMYDTTGQLVK